jgi:hypothetical protein
VNTAKLCFCFKFGATANDELFPYLEFFSKAGRNFHRQFSGMKYQNIWQPILQLGTDKILNFNFQKLTVRDNRRRREDLATTAIRFCLL